LYFFESVRVGIVQADALKRVIAAGELVLPKYVTLVTPAGLTARGIRNTEAVCNAFRAGGAIGCSVIVIDLAEEEVREEVVIVATVDYVLCNPITSTADLVGARSDAASSSVTADALRVTRGVAQQIARSVYSVNGKTLTRVRGTISPVNTSGRFALKVGTVGLPARVGLTGQDTASLSIAHALGSGPIGSGPVEASRPYSLVTSVALTVIAFLGSNLAVTERQAVAVGFTNHFLLGSATKVKAPVLRAWALGVLQVTKAAVSAFLIGILDAVGARVLADLVGWVWCVKTGSRESISLAFQKTARGDTCRAF
jgi:hypothetical protein